MSRTFHSEPEEAELALDPVYQEWSACVERLESGDLQALADYKPLYEASLLVIKLLAARDAFAYQCKGSFTGPIDLLQLFRFTKVIKKAVRREVRRTT